MITEYESPRGPKLCILDVEPQASQPLIVWEPVARLFPGKKSEIQTQLQPSLLIRVQDVTAEKNLTLNV
jgi:hypothetical protein